MPVAVSIIILVVGMGLIVWFFNIGPEVSMDKFLKKLNSIRIGMTKNEVHDIMKCRPYEKDAIRNISTGEILYEVEYYRKWTQKSDLNTYKQKITSMEVKVKITYFNGIVENIEQV